MRIGIVALWHSVHDDIMDAWINIVEYRRTPFLGNLIRRFEIRGIFFMMERSEYKWHKVLFFKYLFSSARSSF